jgi:hypothetical protein
MAILLDRLVGQPTGDHDFDSNECSVPGCPGPQQGPHGELVCGQDTPEFITMDSKIGLAAIVNCIVSNSPQQERDFGGNTPYLSDKDDQDNDIYVA